MGMPVATASAVLCSVVWIIYPRGAAASSSPPARDSHCSAGAAQGAQVPPAARLHPPSQRLHRCPVCPVSHTAPLLPLLVQSPLIPCLVMGTHSPELSRKAIGHAAAVSQGRKVSPRGSHSARCQPGWLVMASQGRPRQRAPSGHTAHTDTSHRSDVMCYVARYYSVGPGADWHRGNSTAAQALRRPVKLG